MAADAFDSAETTVNPDKTRMRQRKLDEILRQAFYNHPLNTYRCILNYSISVPL